MYENVVLSEALLRNITTETILKAVYSNLACRVGPNAANEDKALGELDTMIGDLEERNIAMMAGELGLEPAIKLTTPH